MGRLDPRYYQITVLSFLLLYGIFGLDFEVTAGRALAILLATLGAQYGCGRLAGLPRFDPKSALISGLSLSLLLRTSSLALAVAAAALAIASKFGLRFAGKHVFNPTNFGLALLMLVSGKVWVSPGQWGAVAWFGFLLASLGGLVVHRSSRADVTLGFLGFYSAVVFGRALWLGQPWTIPWHQLQSGALLLFSFFMISDPKTTPDSRRGRIFFALLVALGAGAVHFVLYRPNGLIWSLFFLSPLVPLLDRFLPGERYQWERSDRCPSRARTGEPAGSREPSRSRPSPERPRRGWAPVAMRNAARSGSPQPRLRKPSAVARRRSLRSGWRGGGVLVAVRRDEPHEH